MPNMARTFLICLMIVLLVAPSVFARKYPEGIGHHNRNGTRTGGHHKGGHHKSGEAGTSGLTSSKGVTAGKTCKRSSLGYKAAVDPTGKGGVPLPPFCPLSPLPLRPTSLVLDRSVRRLPLAGDAALARARGARARVGLAGVVEVAVGAAGGVGVAVGAVAGVEVAVAAAEAEVAVAVAVGAEAAVAAEVEAAVVEEVELVGVVLLSGAAPGVA
ncbi:unnamed protein product [Closterium sp. NIES-65]|nr:unnamed protein product [Closterium sp. NIES-65]